MDKKIDKKVLEYMEIYEAKNITIQKKKLGLKIKDDLERITDLKIERVYIIDEYAWGKSDDVPSFCFLFDVRVKELKEKLNILEEYISKIDMKILPWTMCQFEKRKNNPTEYDYYIENYGFKIYDSGKLVDIDERVKFTEYASKMKQYRSFYKYEINKPEILMKNLLEIYVLKINYPINDRQELENTIEYVKHISKDKFVLELIEEFKKIESNKLQTCQRLEKYIKNLKQIRPKMELDNIPAMNVYDRLLDAKNNDKRISISNLTKENLYTMNIIQKKMIYDIAKLFEINEVEIKKMRIKYGFKVIDSIWYNHMQELISESTNIYKENIYFILKRLGLFNFEKHTYEILKYMMDGEKYLLKEFWKLLNGKREGIELEKSRTSKDINFRAYFCLEMLKQNGFIEEVDYLKYRINKNGNRLLEKLKYRNIDELNLMEIANINGKAIFFDISIVKSNSGKFICLKNSEKTDEKYCNIDIEEINKIQESKKFNEKQINNLLEVDFKEVTVRRINKSNQNSQTKIMKVDYREINDLKEKLGTYCEKMIYNLEREKLIKENREDLAEKVLWISKEKGDGAGYDIKSFEKKDEKYIEIYIEVKGTNKSINEAFEISKNEIEASNRYGDQYYIYRIGSIYSKSPKFYKINGRIEDNFNLEATSFKARKKYN